MPVAVVKCKRCGTNKSPNWWKCCPEHNTEQGPDVHCEKCVQLLHPGDDEFQRDLKTKIIDALIRLWNKESI